MSITLRESIRRQPSTAESAKKAAAVGHSKNAPEVQRILDLQGSVGNHGVVVLLAAAQPKLKVGSANDRYEREADDVAYLWLRAALTQRHSRVSSCHHYLWAGKLQRNPNVASEAFVDMPQQFVASSPNSPETLLTSVNRTS